MKKYAFLLLVFLLFSTPATFAGEKKTTEDRMETLKIWKLINYLQLTDSQADKFLPRFRTFEEYIRNMQRDKNKKIAEIGRKIKNGNTKGINKDINDVLEYDVKIAQRKKDFFNSIRGIISEEQMAKMIVFEDQFRREVRRMIERRMHMKNGFNGR